jgi:superfamily I DNA/RNA helicase
MNFTREQEAILSSAGNIKINAVAGSGKTTVLLEYAKRREKGSRILYLAFNRSVRMEAQKRCAEQNIHNVDVQTAHSLAFRQTAMVQGYRISKGYKIHDIVKMLGMQPVERDIHSPFIVASHILKVAALFCNSDKARVADIDYCSTISDEKARATAKHFYPHIGKGARLFLAKMDRKEIDSTHDFYLKKFQLSRPTLAYDIILFDEGQDASPVMLNVFLSQKAQKVIVGDMHQQIYGWRHAINALNLVDFPSLSLTTSFRFNNHIAGLAMECLGWKRHLGYSGSVCIQGIGGTKKIRTRATIARTNLALLKNAIDTMRNNRSIKKIYFEGNINSYTYAADGASVYDVLNLYLDNRDRIRDPLIASMKGFGELEEYVEKSGDQELGMLIDIVETYGKELPFLIKKLTGMHVADNERDTADMIFSTLHRSKGMEYDSVTLTDDFITEERVQKLIAREKEEPVDRNKLSEEINLAYVAVTRSKNFINFPDNMFPGADKSLFSPEKKKAGAKAHLKFDKSWQIGEKRRIHANAYAPWTGEQDALLTRLFYGGALVRELAERFGRNDGAIRSRLKKLGAWDF